MNARCFRLISSRIRGMLVPVGENATAMRGKRHSKATRASASVLSAALLGAAAAALADTTLPVPTLGIDSANIAASGAATAAINGATLTVDQSSLRAVIDWQSFNVGSGGAVNFNHQLGAASATLNRIHDLNPSIIQGSIRAAGEIYLFNQNGILFKDGASVDVGSLVASTLQIHNDAFSRGFLSLPIGANAQAAFTWGGTKSEFETSLIEVSPNATLRASTGGRVMVLAPKVVNHGTIAAPEGQVVLAGGAKVFLTAPLDATLRGFLVEVDPYQTFDAGGTPTDVTGGTVTNAAPATVDGVRTPGGRVLVDRGNATLAAYAVNQNGRVSATTSVSVNGSVFLQARDQVSQASGISTVIVNGNVEVPRGQRTGTVTFGVGSVTEVMPDVNDRTTTQDAQGFTPSRIDVVGRRVVLETDSLLRAPAGDITLSAQSMPLFQVPGSPLVEDVRIFAAAGARIDVSGTAGVTLSVARNFVTAELRGNELRDSPVLRNSFLRGQEVTVDIRKGTPLGDVSGFLAQIGRAVDERTVAGGNITLQSEGEVILLQGSALDVSGETITYLEARAAETRLLGADGKVYAVSDATPDRLYTGFADRAPETDIVTGRATGLLAQNTAVLPIESGYTEGRSAGSIAVVAHRTVLDGALSGHATAGTFQRSVELAPRGGELRLGDLSAEGAAAGDSKLRALAFVSDPARLPASFTADSVLDAAWRDRTFIDPQALFQGGGFTRLAASANGAVTIAANAPIALAPGGVLSLAGRTIDVSGHITVAGGTVSLATREVSGEPTDDRARYALSVAEGVRIDTAGLWTNDRRSLNPTRPTSTIALDGGTIALRSAGDVLLGRGSLLDVSAGARVDEAGSLAAGDAGRITLVTGRIGISESNAQVSRVELGGELRGDAVVQPRGGVHGAGGVLEISTSTITIGTVGTGAAGELLLSSAFFGQGGFSSFELNGQDGLRVRDGSVVSPVARARLLDGADLLTRATGTPMTGLGQTWTPAPVERSPGAIALRSNSTVFGHVQVDHGASVQVDPHGTIAIESGRRVTILGALEAPAGSITVGNAPPGSNDVFESDVSVWIGDTARLYAKGSSQSIRNPLGKYVGDVHDGGSIVLNAAKGFLVIASGAQLDVSGVVAGRPTETATGSIRMEDRLDLATTTALGLIAYRDNAAVASSGGTIALSAREGMFVDGTLQADAGRAATATGAGTSGGTLRVSMTAGPQFGFPGTDKRIVVSAAAGLGGNPTFLAPGTAPGGAMPAVVGGVAVGGAAWLGADAVNAAGFSAVELLARDRIEFTGDVALTAARSLALDAPEIRAVDGANARLQAAAVSLGSSDLFRQLTIAPVAGTGTLEVDARVVDVVGSVTVNGVDRLTLRSTSLPATGSQAALVGGDIRLRGVVVDTDPGAGVVYGLTGSLTTGASLVRLEGERIHPTTASGFTLSAAGGAVEFLRPAFSSGVTTVLSAGGSLLVQARTIRQDTLLAAPFGTLRLEATESVVLGPASITTVSGGGELIPFGRTELSGKDYVYGLGGSFGSLVFETPPEKRIELSGSAVTMLRESIGGVVSEALVDLSGGGDLLAYEFVPGPGGSRDLLNAAVSSGSFAVLPGVASAYGPYDHQYQQGVTGLRVGDQVALTGVTGLPDGVYTLLPPAYASLPGAYLVTPQAGARDLPAGVVGPQYLGAVAGALAGAQVVSAVRTARNFDGTSVRDERTSLFLVESRSVIDQRAEYARTTAGNFFADTANAQLPGDAGRLVLETDGLLALDGRIAGAAVAGRRSLEVDIAAPAIRVLSSPRTALAGYLDLDVTRLNAFGASSLLLGGRRSTTGDVLTIVPGSSSVILANVPDDPLTAADVMLVAAGSIVIEDGAEIEATGAGAPRPASIAIAGNGAFARVSGAPLAQVTRTGFDRSAGSLAVGVGALLRSEGSVILDATFTTSLAATARIESPAVALAAGRIDLGAPAGATDGLVIGGDLLARFGSGDALALTSYSTIDIHGPVDIGTLDADGRPALASLTLDAPAINGFGAGDRRFRAGALTLRNGSGRDLAATGDGVGSLSFQALGDGTASGGTLVLGPGTMRISGADLLLLEGDREVRFAGVGDLSGAVDELRVVTSVVTADVAAEGRLASSGLLSMRLPVDPIAGSTAAGLGARLTFSGARMEIATPIVLPSGTFEALATGAATTDTVHLADGARIDVAGTEVIFTEGVTRGSDGGTARLRTVGGDIVIASGAAIDVSAGGTGAVAGVGGLVELRSGRTLQLGGALRGTGGGRILADVATGADLDAFAAAALAGEFSGGQTYRARAGDIVLSADRAMTASEIRLVADAGAIDVAGLLDARADKGGRIELWASGDVTARGTARLLAAASGDAGDGGRVFLGTSNGAIAVQKDAVVDVSGGANGAGGEMWLRAPRTAGDVAVATFAPTLVGTDEVIVEAFAVVAAETIGTTAGSDLDISDSGDGAQLFEATRDYLAVARPAVEARLAPDTTATIRLRPGIEVRGASVSLTSDWNFFCGIAATCAGSEGMWSFDGEPGVLTLRSAGNVALDGTLNDGFRALPPASPTTASITVMNDAYVARAGGGWSYRIVAGADLTGADVLATDADAAGDVVLAAGRLVRTSDGFIDVAAARDVVLTDARAVMYTAGEPGPVVPGFVAPNPPSVAGQPRAHAPTYTQGGGDLRVVAGRDLRGAASGQSVTEWLYRDVRRNARNEILPNPQTTWWVRFDAFQQGVGALGGGDVLMAAGRDIVNVSGAVPTNARLGGNATSAPDAANFVEQGGGDLTVRAGRDVLSGLYVVQRGSGDIRAGRDIGSGTSVGGEALNAMFALGDAAIDVRAGRDAAIQGVFNPTIQRQPRGNIGTTGLLTSYFLTYGEGASFDLSVLTGTATLANHRDLLPLITGSPLASFGSSGESASAVIHPGTVRVAALSGDVRVERGFVLAPDRRGQLELLAAEDVTVGGRILMSDVSPLSLPGVLSPDRVYSNAIEPLLVNAAEQGSLFHDESVLHAGDTTPIRIVAATGDVRGPVDDVSGIAPLGVFAKSMLLVAGRDVVDTWVIGQNVNRTDITRLEAGRDLRFNTLRDTLGKQRTNLGGIQWGGPGELQVNTGRDVDLGNSQGLVTRGNLDNPFLPESGADIRIATGSVAPDYATFLDTYLSTDLDRLAAWFPLQVRQFVLDETGSDQPDGPSALAALRGLGAQKVDAFVESVSYRTELVAYMRARTGDAGLAPDAAVAQFRALDRPAQTAFVNSVLFDEIRLAGNPGDLANALAGFDVRGYRALAALYPVAPEIQAGLTEGNFVALVDLIGRSYGKNVKPLLVEMAAPGFVHDPNDGARAFARNHLALSEQYGGDVSLFFSQVKTEQGGAIEMRVPGGLVNAGLANPGTDSKGASELGIVTVRGGSVQAAVLEDFLVNQSRVFTLGGGDIRLWSSFGNIDAGKGAKTASATPPPQIVIRNGKFVLDTSRSVEGSGIAVLLSRQDVPPGNSELITPLGEVDAGDAGIRVAGNLVVRAQTVANANNVSTGGTASGVPAASGSLSIGLSGTSSVDSQTTAAVAKAAEAAAERGGAGAAVKSIPSFITVEVIGLGDDDDRALR